MKIDIFNRLSEGLTKTRKNITARMSDVIGLERKFDQEQLDELEEILISSDIGITASEKILSNIKRSGDLDIISAVKQEVMTIFDGLDPEMKITDKPSIVLVVGVNGAGKTTSIGKMAAKLSSEGKKVMIVAGDTFRAAATEQLKIWAERSGAGFVSHAAGSDPAAVVYDGIQAAISRGYDVVIIDTAGRLQNNNNLMKELNKIDRIIKKERPEGAHEVLLAIDATSGQNALSQVKLFSEITGVTGIILNKLDGSAKGGIVIAIANEYAIPVKYVGIGEKIGDLVEFSAEEFVEAIFL